MEKNQKNLVSILQNFPSYLLFMTPCLIQGMFLRAMDKDNDIDKDNNNQYNIDILHYGHKCLVLESGNKAELLIESTTHQKACFLYANNDLAFLHTKLFSSIITNPHLKEFSRG